jgi:integrase
MKEARACRDLVLGELAQRRNPAEALRMLVEAPPAVTTISTMRDEYLASRFKDENTIKSKRTALKKFCATYGGYDPHTVTARDAIAYVTSLVEEGKKPSTINLYVLEARLLLDFAGVAENPFRDKTVELPKQVRDEPHPVPVDHYLAALDKLPKKWLLVVMAIEQGGLREGEAVNLRWGDVGEDGLRLRASATKRDRFRWVKLPAWLMKAIHETCPEEDRTPDRRVFPGTSEQALYQAWVRACRDAKVPHYTVHDLRDRRGTIWHHEDKLVARELADRLGHSDPWMSLNVYAGAMPVKEAKTEDLLARLKS